MRWLILLIFLKSEFKTYWWDFGIYFDCYKFKLNFNKMPDVVRKRSKKTI